MPIYEYQCEACGAVVESWQKCSDPPLTSCEQCGGAMHKLISQSAFHLKGSGWYVTDYAGKKGGQKAAGSTPASPAKKESSTSSDT